MDYNSHIFWQKGTPITSDLLNGMRALLEDRQETFVRLMTYSRCGITPNAEFSCKAVFCGRNLVVERLLCRACLASGKVLDVDQRVELPFPTLLPGEYYFTIGLDEKQHVFQSKGMEYACPEYKFEVMNFDQLKENDVLPLLKLQVSATGVSIDYDYIAPFLVCGSDPRILEKIARVIELADNIANHPHLQPGIDQRMMKLYAFLLRNINKYDSLSQIYTRLKDFLLAQHFHVFQSNGREGQVIEESLFFFDIVAFLDLLMVSQESAILFLDTVTPVDTKIDFEKLKAEIKEELEPVIKEELVSQLKPELHDQLYDELKSKIKEEVLVELRPIVLDKVVTEVKERFEEMRPAMHDRLYRELYDALFADLKLCKPIEEDNFMPDI